jgi:hypothetical protein
LSECTQGPLFYISRGIRIFGGPVKLSALQIEALHGFFRCIIAMDSFDWTSPERFGRLRLYRIDSFAG